MFDHENVASVNPSVTRAEQLAGIRLESSGQGSLGVIALQVPAVL